MDKESDFYVYLISDGCSHVYPDNKMSRFKVVLPKQLRLNKSFRVCLRQIHFPTELDDPPPEFKSLAMFMYNTVFPTKQEPPLPPVIRPNITLNANIVTPKEDTHTNSVREENEEAEDDEELHTPPISRNEHGNRPVVVNNFGKQLYVYTDIIQPIVVASEYMPLLAVVPFSPLGLFEPLHPVFHRLIGQDIQTVSVWICDHLSRPVRFRTGRVIILLHFIAV